jgi:Ala-tRNA(Pro) deacylase
MFYISDISSSAPVSFRSNLQKKVYDTLSSLSIPFYRVTTDIAVTMDDCVLINKKLDINMVKTLFLCNRQLSQFYLFITRGDKAFCTKNFSHALGIPRVSFAPVEKMSEMLHTEVGATTIFSSLLDSARSVEIIVDNEVAESYWFGCSDGTTTGYLKISTRRVLCDILKFTNHDFKIIHT